MTAYTLISGVTTTQTIAAVASSTNPAVQAGAQGLGGLPQNPSFQVTAKGLGASVGGTVVVVGSNDGVNFGTVTTISTGTGPQAATTISSVTAPCQYFAAFVTQVTGGAALSCVMCA
jgi:hypothetical protein